MFLTIISAALILVLVEVTALDESNSGEFDFSKRCSTQNQHVEDRLNKLERRLESDINKLELQIKETHKEKRQLELDERINQYQQNEGLPKNCEEVQNRGNNISHIYRIKPDPLSKAFFVLCNMDTRGGGWTYLLNRFDGSQDFYLNWTDYKNGFGNLAGEFWLGLEHLHQLTANELNELLIELVDHDQKEVYAHYTVFNIGSEIEGYKLTTVGGYTGDAGDSFGPHVGMKFSTQDEDHDLKVDGACATMFDGAWWYNDCYWSHLTGRYLEGNESNIHDDQGIYWADFHGYNYSLKQARMMIKPRVYKSPALVPHRINN